MKGCLSTRALLRLLAGDGTEEQRGHVATCGTCSHRYRRLGRDLETVDQVLLRTAEPRTALATRTWLWVPASVVAAVLAAVVVFWGYSGVRAPVGRARQPMAAEEMARALEDVSRTMFSIEGHPAAPLLETRLLGAQSAEEFGCDSLDWPASAGCDESPNADRLPNLYEPSDSDL